LHAHAGAAPPAQVVEIGRIRRDPRPTTPEQVTDTHRRSFRRAPVRGEGRLWDTIVPTPDARHAAGDRRIGHRPGSGSARPPTPRGGRGHNGRRSWVGAPPRIRPRIDTTNR